YVMASDAILTELIPDNLCEGRYRMLMTNLDLRASPIIRFDSGDLASVKVVDGIPLITAFEGRLIDTIVCRDGTQLSPYRITDALRDVAGVKQFKVTQHQLDSLTVDLQADGDARDHAEKEIREIFRNLLGEGI